MEKLQDDISKGQIGKLLGEGAYSKVKLFKLEDQSLARKKIRDFNDKYEIRQELIYELDALIKFQSINTIINLKIIDLDNNSLYLELMETSLFDFIQRNHFEQRMKLFNTFMSNMIKTLFAFESNNFVHFDIKPQNIMLNKNLFVLIDFGLSHSPINSHDYCVSNYYTQGYKPPEYIFNINCNFSHQGDIWAMGMTFIEYIIGCNIIFTSLFGKDELDHMLKWTTDKMKNWNRDDISSTYLYLSSRQLDVSKLLLHHLGSHQFSQINDKIITIISQMVYFDPNKRITGHELYSQLFDNFPPNLITYPEFPRQINKNGINLILKIGYEISETPIPVIMAIEIYTRYLSLADDKEMKKAIISLRLAEYYANEYQYSFKKINKKFNNVFTKKELRQGIIDMIVSLNGLIYNPKLHNIISKVPSDYEEGFRSLKVFPKYMFSQPLDKWNIFGSKAPEISKRSLTIF